MKNARFNYIYMCTIFLLLYYLVALNLGHLSSVKTCTSKGLESLPECPVEHHNQLPCHRRVGQIIIPSCIQLLRNINCHGTTQLLRIMVLWDRCIDTLRRRQSLTRRAFFLFRLVGVAVNRLDFFLFSILQWG